jgi:hypothetical protein
VKEEVLVLKAARVRDEAIELADRGDFGSARRRIERVDRDLRAAGLHDEADALKAAMPIEDAYDPMARKPLRYESNMRRRRGTK